MGDANLIINYLPQTLTERELYTMFITIGPIQSCRIVKDFKTDYSYGFGFVNYHKREDAEKAIQQLNGLQLLNKTLKVSFARKCTEPIKDTNVYITNIPRHLTSEELRAHLEQYGEILQLNLLKDKITGMPRGAAFVRYNLQEEARAAIKNLNGKMLFDGSAELLVARLAEELSKQRVAYQAGLTAGVEHGSRRWRPLVNHRGQPGPNAIGRGRGLVDFRGQPCLNAFGRGRGLVEFRGQPCPNAFGRGRGLVNFRGQPGPNTFGRGRGLVNVRGQPGPSGQLMASPPINCDHSGYPGRPNLFRSGVGPVKRGLGQHRFNPMT